MIFIATCHGHMISYYFIWYLSQTSAVLHVRICTYLRGYTYKYIHVVFARIAYVFSVRIEYVLKFSMTYLYVLASKYMHVRTYKEGNTYIYVRIRTVWRPLGTYWNRNTYMIPHWSLRYVHIHARTYNTCMNVLRTYLHVLLLSVCARIEIQIRAQYRIDPSNTCTFMHVRTIRAWMYWVRICTYCYFSMCTY